MCAVCFQTSKSLYPMEAQGLLLWGGAHPSLETVQPHPPNAASVPVLPPAKEPVLHMEKGKYVIFK